MTDLLSGQISYVFMVAVLDAALLSWLALQWYRRSVRRLMRPRSSSTIPRPASDLPSASIHDMANVPAQLTFAIDASPHVGDALEATRVPAIRANRWRVSVAYCAGAGTYALLVAIATLRGSGTSLPAWFAVWWAHLWPIVPTLTALLVFERTRTIVAVIAYLVVGALLVSLVTLLNQIAHGHLNNAPLTNMYFVIQLVAITAVFPLGLVMLTAWRRIRGVMPLSLAATTLFGLASLFFRQGVIAAFNQRLVRGALLNLSAITSADFAYYGLFLVVALPVGWIVWKLLERLAASFARRRFSDLQLVVDCWWVIVAAVTTATDLTVRLGAPGIAIGVAAFGAYRLGVEAVLRGARPRHLPAERLLLLRVFGYQARTESLFDSIAQWWRFRGPVRLVAGVDLATRTADPGDVLALLSGRLATQYIADVADIADIAGRIERLDDGCDPDGRFRINELFCRDETWRATLQALLDASDVVLMDLRSFSPRNAGCLFELEQLVARVPIDSVVLVCDRTTDLELLERTLGDAWELARRDGRARGSGRVALVRVDRQARPERRQLMASLTAAAERTRAEGQAV